MQKRSALVLPFVNRLKTTSALDLGHSCLEAQRVFVTIRYRIPITKSVREPIDSERELYSGLCTFCIAEPRSCRATATLAAARGGDDPALQLSSLATAIQREDAKRRFRKSSLISARSGLC